MSLRTITIVCFILMYVGMIFLPRFRHLYALGVAAVFLVLGILPVSEIGTALDWNVLFMLCGTMILVDYFIESGMPDLIAGRLLRMAPNVMWVTILMSLFAGAISALIDNVSTVLMVAPVGLAICKSLGISPVNMIITIAVSSNLQGAATLVGDTTSIMLGAYAGMDFMDFFWRNGRPGIFFAVELGALATIPIMMWIFRKEKRPVQQTGPEVSVEDMIPTYTLLGLIVTLVAVSFWRGKPGITNGLICMCFAVLTMLLELALRHNRIGMKHSIRMLDTSTLLMLAGLFLVIAGVSHRGIIMDLASFVAKAGGNNIFLLYTIIVWGSVVISAFVDNIPYVAAMLPLLQNVTTELGVPADLLYFGLLVGATLGGNLTPVGASANIAGIGILEKGGCHVSFGQFMKIGVPFTLAAVLTGYVYIWVFYH